MCDNDFSVLFFVMHVFLSYVSCLLTFVVYDFILCFFSVICNLAVDRNINEHELNRIEFFGDSGCAMYLLRRWKMLIIVTWRHKVA
jgi:hypothetical protein